MSNEYKCSNQPFDLDKDGIKNTVFLLQQATRDILCYHKYELLRELERISEAPVNKKAKGQTTKTYEFITYNNVSIDAKKLYQLIFIDMFNTIMIDNYGNISPRSRQNFNSYPNNLETDYLNGKPFKQIFDEKYDDEDDDHIDFDIKLGRNMRYLNIEDTKNYIAGNYWTDKDCKNVCIIPEKINIQNLKKLLLPKNIKKLKIIFEQYGMRFKKTQYVKLLKNVNPDTGIANVKYTSGIIDDIIDESSGNDHPTGRKFAKQFGYQITHSLLRGAVGYNDYYLDFDFTNCHPTIALALLQKNGYYDTEGAIVCRDCNDEHRKDMHDRIREDTPCLKRYVNDRNSIYEEFSRFGFSPLETKMMLICVFNGMTVRPGMKICKAKLKRPADFVVNNPPKFLYDLSIEMRRIYGFIHSKYHKNDKYLHVCNLNPHAMSLVPYVDSNGIFTSDLNDFNFELINAPTRFFIRLLHEVENECLFHAWNYFRQQGFKPASLIFDGLAVEKNERFRDGAFVTQFLQGLNEYVRLQNENHVPLKLEIKNQQPILPEIQAILNERYEPNVTVDYYVGLYYFMDTNFEEYESIHNIYYYNKGKWIRENWDTLIANGVEPYSKYETFKQYLLDNGRADVWQIDYPKLFDKNSEEYKTTMYEIFTNCLLHIDNGNGSFVDIDDVRKYLKLPIDVQRRLSNIIPMVTSDRTRLTPTQQSTYDIIISVLTTGDYYGYRFDKNHPEYKTIIEK